jgi:hypothetical protein
MKTINNYIKKVWIVTVCEENNVYYLSKIKGKIKFVEYDFTNNGKNVIAFKNKKKMKKVYKKVKLPSKICVAYEFMKGYIIVEDGNFFNEANENYRENII